MLIEDVIKHFGTPYKASMRLGISVNTPKNWKKIGYIPIVTQVKIEHLTDGVLRADLSHCRKVEDDPISE